MAGLFAMAAKNGVLPKSEISNLKQTDKYTNLQMYIKGFQSHA
jgi:hypothetical protein